MKVHGTNGEWAFRALVKISATEWMLTNAYFFSVAEARAASGTQDVRWPVELNDNAAIYVPSQEELQ